MNSLLLSLGLAILFQPAPHQPETVQITEYRPIIPESGSTTQSWTCRGRVAVLQASWTTNFAPGQPRRLEALHLSAMVDGVPVVDSNFQGFQIEVEALAEPPIFRAWCSNDRFTIEAGGSDAWVRWSEPR